MALVDVSTCSNLIRAAEDRNRREAQRRTARIAGWFFVVTFVTSIPEVFLYKPLLKHTDYVLGSGAPYRHCHGSDP